MIYLATSQTTDGNGTGFHSKTSEKDRVPIIMWGTWDGATVELKFLTQDSGAVEFAIDGSAQTDNWAGFVTMPGAGKIISTISSAGASTDLNVAVNL